MRLGTLARVWGVGMLLAGLAWGEESVYEIVRYTAPAGWKVSDGPGQTGKVFTSPDSTASDQAMILLVVSPAQEGLDLTMAFETAVKGVSSNGKVVESSEVISSKTRQGFDALSRTLVVQGEGNQKAYARMIGAKVDNRMAGIFYLAKSQALYDAHQAEMAALLQSVSFTSGAPAAVDVAAAKKELEALGKEKQALLAKVAEIEARERRLTAAMGGGGATPANGEQLLAAAREQFVKDVAARRKPHVVQGTILGLNGKPIPDVAEYRVEVWGTTIAAERTRYGLDVDQTGHFEQQVPDGLYQVRATCLVNHRGRRVPVDLIWLDDKKVGVDQSSAGGIVRDFRLVMTGLRPGENPKGDHAYFGGTFRLNGPAFDLTRGHLSTRYPGATVAVTLTPQGSLVDGSRGEAFTIPVGVDELNYSTTRRNIPIGVYTVTAVLTDKNGGKLALTCARDIAGEYGRSVELAWESSKDNAEMRIEPLIYLKD
jgi:hypothetical protein